MPSPAVERWKNLAKDLSTGRELLTAIRHDQETRWLGGDRVRAEEYIRRFPQLTEEDAMVVLLAELQLRQKRGEPPDLADYQRQYPQFADDLPMQWQALNEMFGESIEESPPTVFEINTVPDVLEQLQQFLAPKSELAGTALPPLETLMSVNRLLPVDGTPAIPLADRLNLIGRQASCVDIMLKHPSISKQHCIIFPTHDGWHVRDLDSTNGIKVNGTRIIRGIVQHGDELEIGKYKCRVELRTATPRSC